LNRRSHLGALELLQGTYRNSRASSFHHLHIFPFPTSFRSWPCFLTSVELFLPHCYHSAKRSAAILCGHSHQVGRNNPQKLEPQQVRLRTFGCPRHPRPGRQHARHQHDASARRSKRHGSWRCHLPREACVWSTCAPQGHVERCGGLESSSRTPDSISRSPSPWHRRTARQEVDDGRSFSHNFAIAWLRHDAIAGVGCDKPCIIIILILIIIIITSAEDSVSV
jgi:hypothetical protein